MPNPLPHSRRTTPVLALLALALVAACLLRLCISTGGLGWPDASALELRAPRVASAVIVGWALALGGVLLQCLLRNPLASPDIMGLSSGSGLVIVAAAFASATWGWTSPPTTSLAFLGAFGSLTLVYLLSQRRGLVDPVTLVLVGVIVGILCSSAGLLLQQLMPDRGSSTSRWLLGSIDEDASWLKLAWTGGLTFIVGLGSVALAPDMDAASLSDDEARSVGVPLGRLRLFMFLGAGTLAATSVVLAGPVGFVGLICPHLVRLLIGPAHRPLLIGSALAGGILVVLADTLVRSIESPGGRLPIGVLTSMIGGPVLILLLRNTLRR